MVIGFGGGILSVPTITAGIPPPDLITVLLLLSSYHFLEF
jgi:hypothetical protein